MISAVLKRRAVTIPGAVPIQGNTVLTAIYIDTDFRRYTHARTALVETSGPFHFRDPVTHWIQHKLVSYE